MQERLTALSVTICIQQQLAPLRFTQVDEYVQMDAIKIPGLEEIQKATENLNQISLAIQKIKPKNCGCTCGNESVRADTVSH